MFAFRSLKATLQGWPDTTLTAGLLLVAAILVAVALFSQRPLVKALVLAWAVLP